MGSQPSDLERSILHTLCWFAVSEYPLTAFEVWKWLWGPVAACGLAEVKETLETSPWLASRLERADGWYALRGTLPLAEQIRRRQERFVDAARKFKKLRRAARWFALLPTVRAVGAGNTLAWWYTRAESDIDLFIVAAPGTVWLTRLLSVLPFLISRQRPGTTAADPFCFSFFVTEEKLGLSSLRLFGVDPYLAYWSRSLVPVFDREDVFNRFWHENNWVSEFLPHTAPRSLHTRLAHGYRADEPPVPASSWWRKLESFARRIQEFRLPASLRAHANKDSSVVLTAHMIKFHENDRRAEFRDRFQAFVISAELGA